jgi:hypothetical protein
MGADIYLKSVNSKCQKKNDRLFKSWALRRDQANEEGNKLEAARCQKKVSFYYDAMYAEGYFRDSYNGTSLFQRLGLSWWGLPINKKGLLPIAEMIKLRAKLEVATIPVVTKEELLKQGCSVDEGENSPTSWTKYFEGKKADLITLLDKGIELGEPLYCSV